MTQFGGKFVVSFLLCAMFALVTGCATTSVSLDNEVSDEELEQVADRNQKEISKKKAKKSRAAAKPRKRARRAEKTTKPATAGTEVAKRSVTIYSASRDPVQEEKKKTNGLLWLGAAVPVAAASIGLLRLARKKRRQSDAPGQTNGGQPPGPDPPRQPDGPPS